MDPYFLPFNLRDLFLGLAYVAGAGVGVIAVLRGHTRLGILVIAGFLLFSVDVIAEIVLYRVLTNSYSEAFDWIYACLSSAGMVLGVVSLSVAFYLAITSSHPADTPPTA